MGEAEKDGRMGIRIGDRRRGHHGSHRRPARGELSGPGGALCRHRRMQPRTPGGLPAAVYPAQAA